MTLIELDVKIKDLLKEAGDAGIEIEHIYGNYVTISSMACGTTKYILQDYQVSYGRANNE